MTYTNRKRIESGNNGQSKQYLTLNETFRIYQFLKDNKDDMFNISKICQLIFPNNNTIYLKPKLLFLIKLDLIEIVRPQNILNKSNSVKYYRYKNGRT